MQRLEAELQVPLFDRQKNRIEFNENGRMAAECARQVVQACQDMVRRVQAFDRSRRTILLGSCAPVPLWEIPPVLSSLYPDRTISSEMRENDVLLQGLRGDVYQLIILPYPVEEPGDFLRKIRGGTPVFLPAAGASALRKQGPPYAGSQRRNDAPAESVSDFGAM